MDTPESRRQRTGGIPAESLLADGDDRDRAATMEMLQERVETTETVERRGLSVAEDPRIHRGSSNAHRTDINGIVQLPKSGGHRRQPVEAETINLRENVSHRS